MANDFSSRIGARSTGLTTRDRPTPDDIDDLRRRQEEHAKRTQQAPKQSFESYLVGRGGDAPEGGNPQPEPEEPEAAEEGHKDKPSRRAVEAQTAKGNTPKGSLVTKPKLPPMAGSSGRIIRG